MPKVIMTCGKICSGKNTYAQKLRLEYSAVILSVDEITLALFGNEAGEKLDDYVCRAENYLYNKSLEIIETGTNVILDWGFWTKSERELARDFYNSHGIENEFHYINITDEEWHRRIEKRNSDISAPTSSVERFQFSVEKAYTVRYSTPIFLQYVAILRKFSEPTA